MEPNFLPLYKASTSVSEDGILGNTIVGMAGSINSPPIFCLFGSKQDTRARRSERRRWLHSVQRINEWMGALDFAWVKIFVQPHGVSACEHNPIRKVLPVCPIPTLKTMDLR